LGALKAAIEFLELPFWSDLFWRFCFDPYAIRARAVVEGLMNTVNQDLVANRLGIRRISARIEILTIDPSPASFERFFTYHIAPDASRPTMND
jgi:hypothetical protein